MTGFRRILLVIAATAGLAAGAWAEGIFPVNDRGSGIWVFDQPSVVASGTVLHVAFVGNSAAGADSTDTRLFYAAVNGGADFANKSTTESHVRLTAPVAIDNGDAYANARHPQIVARSATLLEILFQAIPSGETDYKLFHALIKIGSNAVTSQRVAEIRDAAGVRIPGRLTDPTFGIVTSDNTLRIAFSSFPSLVAGSPYSDVYYARVGSDNTRVIGNPILLTKLYPPVSTASSAGVFPLPRLHLDSNKNIHIAWAANNSAEISTPTGIYYAMVKTAPSSVVDNIAIGATQILAGGYRWGFPNVLVQSPHNVWIVAADEPPAGTAGLAGALGITELNPYAVTHDGNPVNVNNLGRNSLFYLNPPGGSVLSSDFDTYRPEAILDPQTQNRVHISGYGFRGDPPLYQGTPGRYYVMLLGTTSSGSGTSSTFATMVGSPVFVGTGDIAFALQLPGDYTRPAFAYLSGKSVNFWSGPDNVVQGARNLYVTSASPSLPTKQSGCSMVDEPRRDEAGRIPGAAVLLLPAALLALRRAARKAFGR